MKKITLFLSIIVLMAQSLYSQVPVDSIQIIGTGKDTRLMQGGKELDYNELKAIMRSNPKATRMIKSARLTRNTASSLICVGSLGLGLSLSSILFEGKSSWSPIVVYAASIIGGFTVGNGSKKDRQAAELYNRGLRGTTGFIEQPNEIKVGVTGSGVGLVMGF